MAAQPPQQFFLRRAMPTRLKCGYNGADGICQFNCTQYRAMAIHNETTHSCGRCGTFVYSLAHHLQGCIMQGRGVRRFVPSHPDAILPYKEASFSLRDSLLIYVAPITREDECMVAKVFETLYWPTQALLEQAIESFSGVKVSFRILASMLEVKYDVHHENDIIMAPFMPLTHIAFFDSVLLNSCNFIISSLNLYLRNSSDWQIVSLKELQVHLAEYQPIRGRAYVKTPPELAKRRGLISIQAVADCFKYSLLCGVYGDEILRAGLAKRARMGYKDDHKSKATKYILENPMYYVEFLNWLNLDFLGHKGGVSLEEIQLVEDRFPSFSISVYGHRGGDTIVLRATRERKEHQVNLLLIKHPEKELYHYICIRDFSAFQGKHLQRKREICNTCQKSSDLRYTGAKSHKCGGNAITIKLPRRATVSFSRFDALLLAPFVIYFKFFYIQVAPSSSTPTSSKAIVIEKRVPIAYTILVAERGGRPSRFFHQGKDCVEHFFITLLDVGKNKIRTVNKTNKFIVPDRETLLRHNSVDNCEVCGIRFSKQKDQIRTYHHDHWTGLRATQVVCTACNLSIKPKNSIAAITLGGFRNELKFLLQQYRPKNVKIDPIIRKGGEYIGLKFKSSEKYEEFEMHYSIRLMDIGNFRPDVSLEGLVGEMKGSELGFKLFKETFGQKANEQEYLVGDGGLFYPTFSSVQEFFDRQNFQFVSCSQEPLKLALLRQQISNADFIRHTCNAETALLADIFEEMRHANFKEYELDISSFWSISSFTREAGLLWERGLKLEPVTCPEISPLLPRGIFGGVIQTTKLKAISNSEGNSNYNHLLPPLEICSADISMSYSSRLLGSLPKNQIQIMTREELDSIVFEDIDLEGEWGYLFCVDLDYENEKVKRDISEFPFPPERRRMKFRAMSAFQEKGLLAQSRKFVECERVLLTLYPKYEQVYYYKFLVWMIKHGAVVTQRHVGVKFRMGKIFNSFASHNVKTRYSAPCELIRQMKKSMNNNFVGKLQVVSSDYPNVKFIGSSVEAVEEIGKDTFQSFDIIDEGLALFESKKHTATDVNLKLIALAVLSDAKQRLYELYWDHLKVKFGKNISPLYSHTDSLIFQCTLPRQEVLQGLKELGDIFDFSSLPRNHFLFDESKKGMPGLFKLQGDNYLEFYSAGTAQYSLLVDPLHNGEKEGSTIKASGIPKAQAAKLRHKDFKRVVDEGGLCEEIKIKRVKLDEDAILSIESARVGLGNVNFGRYFVSESLSYPFGDDRIV